MGIQTYKLFTVPSCAERKMTGSRWRKHLIHSGSLETLTSRRRDVWLDLNIEVSDRQTMIQVGMYVRT